MKIISLVTGGAGFIGSHIVHHLLKSGQQVVVLDDLSGGVKHNVNPSADLVVGSIVDTDLVNRLFAEYNFTYVYHLAAYAAEGLSHFIRKYNYENNVIGSINLINASVNSNIKHFVFTSSIAVYGSGKVPLKEDQHPEPEDPYGIAKYAVELDLKNACKLFGLTYTIFRPHNVYGPNQNINDPYRNVIGIFIRRLLEHKDLPVFGDGEQKRAFTYIDDVAPYIASCINVKGAKNQIFNIGSDQIMSVNALANEVAGAMNKQASINHLTKREEVQEAYSDHTKFNRIFKPSPSVSLNEGLKLMVDWVNSRTNTNQTASVPIEIMKNMPEFWKGK